MIGRLFCGFLLCWMALGPGVSPLPAQVGPVPPAPPATTIAPAAPATDGTDTANLPRPAGPIAVKSILFKAEGDASEKVLIAFSQLFMPKIFSIEGEKPRIVLDVENAAPLAKRWSLIRTQGKWVRQIRAAQDPKTRAVRIVLDMEPQKNYHVNQVFYKAELLYVLDITEEKKR